MIASVSGKILHIGQTGIVVEVGGVGLLLQVPAPLRDEVRPGDSIFLHTQLIVRQDALALYGFQSAESRDLFVLLLNVEGIGPKLSLAILSTLSSDAIRRAIFNEQAEIFGRVPGVGKKTAQKILLTLQDKVGALGGLETFSAISDVDGEVLNALTSLGYSIVEAQAAIQAIGREVPQTVEDRLRHALQYFSS